MNFSKALKALSENKAVRHISWVSNVYLVARDNALYFVNDSYERSRIIKTGSDGYNLELSDLLSNDWEII